MRYSLQASEEAGHEICQDLNDGNPLGASVTQSNVDNGVRVTSAGAFLGRQHHYENVTIVTGALASRLVFHGHRIVGVEILRAEEQQDAQPILVHAKEEVILTAGSFQTPQLLLLSGIGPASHLSSLGIPVIQNLPAVGVNMQDHSALSCEFVVKPEIVSHNQLLNDARALKEATAEYQSSHTGPLAVFGCSAAVLFPRLDGVLRSPEMENLLHAQRTFIEAKHRPSTEIWMHSGPLLYTGPCPPDASVLCIEGLCQNNLSRGSLHLSSRDPRRLPIISPEYLSHSYDLRVAKETLREILRLTETPSFSSIIESVLQGPRSAHDQSKLSSSDADDTVLEKFVRENLTQGFHAMSTCVMGASTEPNRVVGPDFQVQGIQGLRIADMSVCPILTSNHTQVNAYLIGERCAEMIIADTYRSKVGDPYPHGFQSNL